MAEYYKLLDFRAGTFVDNHGNYWCDANFEGVSEPVKWVVKDPMKIKVGETYYGKMVDSTSKAGKPYLRFHRESVPDQSTGTRGSDSKSGNDDFAFRCNALNNAVAFTVANNGDVLKTLALADKFLNWLKGDAVLVEQTGYEKAKSVADELRPTNGSISPDEEMPDPEFASLLQQQIGEDINVDEIPF